MGVELQGHGSNAAMALWSQKSNLLLHIMGQGLQFQVLNLFWSLGRSVIQQNDTIWFMILYDIMILWYYYDLWWYEYYDITISWMIDLPYNRCLFLSAKASLDNRNVYLAFRSNHKKALWDLSKFAAWIWLETWLSKSLILSIRCSGWLLVGGWSIKMEIRGS